MGFFSFQDLIAFGVPHEHKGRLFKPSKVVEGGRWGIEVDLETLDW